jgi:siroheme synthase
MPGKEYGEIAAKLLEGGLDVTTPCVIVGNATQAAEAIHRTTLGELALEPRVNSPALLLIGEVARPLPRVKDDEEKDSWAFPEQQEVILNLGEPRIQEEIIG